MKQQSTHFRLKVILASLANLLAVSYIVYLSGYEFLFFVFFFIPVSLCGWYLGRTSVVCMAILSGVSWCLVDILSDHQYSSELIRYGNSFICFIAFASIGVLLQWLRQSVKEHQKAREELEATLAELQTSTEKIRTLQSQLHVVCAWTKRINVEGKWIALDEFLTEQLHTKVSYGVSPEAMHEVLGVEVHANLNAQDAEGADFYAEQESPMEGRQPGGMPPTARLVKRQESQPANPKTTATAPLPMITL